MKILYPHPPRKKKEMQKIQHESTCVDVMIPFRSMQLKLMDLDIWYMLSADNNKGICNSKCNFLEVIYEYGDKTMVNQWSQKSRSFLYCLDPI